jgi:transcriptional regulator with XRE-family HTH domain
VILKQLRLSRHLSQEQLAQMSGLNVRTIQRIENSQNASLESLKCLASVLEVDLSTLKQETFVADKDSSNWQALPIWLKAWFALGTLKLQPSRTLIVRIEVWLHAFGYPLCVFGFVSEPALAGGILLLAHGYVVTLLKWQGDKYAVWPASHGAATT